MMKVRISAAALALGLAVAMASAPAQARTHHADVNATAARAQAIGGEVIGGEAGMTAHRNAALRECTAQANRFGEATYGGDTPSQVYRACMMQHGEAE